MAIVKNNPILEGLSGMLGRTIVYRQMKSPSTGLMMTIVQCAPVRVAPYTAKQHAQQNRFKEAMAYARELLSDPAVKARYRAMAKRKSCGRNLTAFNLAVSEYLKRGIGRKRKVSGRLSAVRRGENVSCLGYRIRRIGMVCSEDCQDRGIHHFISEFANYENTIDFRVDRLAFCTYGFHYP